MDNNLDDQAATLVMRWRSQDDCWADSNGRCQKKETWSPSQNISQAFELLDFGKFLYCLRSSPHSLGVNCKVAIEYFDWRGRETISQFEADEFTAPLAITKVCIQAAKYRQK